MGKVIMDTDLGIDDAFAILLANNSDETDVQAITTVEGNVKLEYANENAFKILDFTRNNNIPVYKGEYKPLKVKPEEAEYVHGRNGLGDVEYDPIDRKIEDMSAVDYLIKSVNEKPNEITIIAIGPLTNIALAVQKDDNFAKNVKKLVIMGGSSEKGNVTKFAEFNFHRDPHAAKIVFKAGFKDIVMVGLNVTEKLPLTENQEKMLLYINSELSNFLYKATRLGAEFDRKMGLGGLIINDALTVAYLIDETVLKLKEANINIKVSGEEIGRSVIDENKTANCRYAYDVDVNKFYKILFRRIFHDNIEIVNKYLD